MRINHILISGRLYRELQPLLAHRKDKEFRYVPEHEVSADDFAWADAYAGFRPVPGFDPRQLQWVHAMGAGIDAFLTSCEWPGDVPLTRTTGAFGAKIGEYCLGYMLSELQHHVKFARDQAARAWNPVAAVPLSGQTAVIFGTGTVGKGIALRLAAFGVRVVGVSLSGRPSPHYDEVYSLAEASSALQEGDWVINTLPLTPATSKLFDRERFAHMRHAGFINVGRGGSVDSEALLDALELGSVRTAVLDVFETEPLPPESPLWSHPAVRITPHISAVTSPEEAAEELLATLDRIEGGEIPLPNRVDPERGY